MSYRWKAARWRIAAKVLAGASLIVSAAFISPVIAQNALPLGPSAGDMDLSPFYRWNGDLPDTPGILLRDQEVPFQEELTAAGAALRILYISTDARWNSGPIPVSGMLFLPAGDAPAGGWPLLSWAHGTLGIADVCAPSWRGLARRDAAYINRWLEQGFAVVATDYQGLGGPGPHPYSYWQAEGRSVLDAARAALEARPEQIDGRIILAGQSQGGGAALGAAIVHDTYAPELNVLGVIASGPNSSFPDGPVRLPPRRAKIIFLTLASGGLGDDGPPVEQILSPEGRQLLAVSRSACTRDLMQKSREMKLGSLEQIFSVPPETLAPFGIPLTNMPMASIDMPLMIATGASDATIMPIRQYAVAKALCAAGNSVTWRLYDGLGHDGAMYGSLDDALEFAQARLSGQSVAGNCADLAEPGAPGERDANAPFNAD